MLKRTLNVTLNLLTIVWALTPFIMLRIIAFDHDSNQLSYEKETFQPETIFSTDI